MTLVVRDEADVIEANLRAHRALGVERFVVLDNGSTDGTAAILGRWEAAGIARVISDPDAGTDEVFREWQTRLARIAADELRADWVINNDADEFWWPLEGDLRTAFGAVPADAHAVIAPRLEFIPRPDGPEPFWERMTIRETGTRVLPKFAHRACADIRVGPGSHYVSSPSLGIAEAAGKPSLRGLRRKPKQPHLMSPAPGPTCAIFHLPLRSCEQYRGRLAIGLRIAEARGSAGFRDRVVAASDPDRAGARWRDELVAPAEEVARRIAAGELVEDRRLCELLRRCGADDPGSPATEARVQPPPDPEAARAELERAALTGLTHSHAQALGMRDAAVRSAEATERRLAEERKSGVARIARVRSRRDRAQRRAQRAEARLRRIRSSRWWRLRPRFPRSQSKR